MKYLFLLLLCLPAYGQTKQSITNLIFEAKTPPYNAPYITSAEINKLRAPVPDMKVNNRLVRVQDNFKWILAIRFLGFRPWWKNRPFKYLSQTELIKFYFEIYLDPKTKEYYQGPFFPLTNTKGIAVPALSPSGISNNSRFVYLTNLQPHVRVYADTANSNMLWGQYLSKIPDFYTGYLGTGSYLYYDPYNKIKVKITPLTNKEYGYVYYKIQHPVSKQVFYMTRSLRYDSGLENELKNDFGSPTGGLLWYKDTEQELIEHIHQEYIVEYDGDTPIFEDESLVNIDQVFEQIETRRNSIFR